VTPVRFSLNGIIGISIIAFSLGLVRIQFGIKMKQSRRLSFVREKDVARADSYFLLFLRPDSYFGDALQDAKQLFLSRLPQMTKYCIMRECEHIPTWISLSGDLAFSHQDGIYGFKFPKRFSELSQAKTSLYSPLFTLFTLLTLII
jgi:hypothetical protein